MMPPHKPCGERRTNKCPSNRGATAAEIQADWPGDRLVSDPETVFTRAIDIEAPPSSVWQWLVQFGLGRAGFYSYELLERIIGIPVVNIESVMPQFQTLGVGDAILLHPTAPGIPVADVRPGERLCFGVSGELADRFEKLDPARSWSMYLLPRGRAGTRLVLRGCVEPLRADSLRARLGQRLEQPIDFVMEQRMLRTIRRLAERPVRDEAAA